jgi:hypothetical protein
MRKIYAPAPTAARGPPRTGWWTCWPSGVMRKVCGPAPKENDKLGENRHTRRRERGSGEEEVGTTDSGHLS